MSPIFITGFWNSGTTLLVDILRKHPKIKLRRARYKPNLEERTIVKLLRKLNKDFIQLDDDYSTVIKHGFTKYHEAHLNHEEQKIFRKHFDRKFHVPENTILLLKNPWLFFMPNFLSHTFNDINLKKTIILRDGPGQIVSKDYWKRTEKDPEQQLYARAKFWVRSMEYYFDYWFEREDTLTLRYENLCHHPEKIIAEICSFYELSFEPLAPTIPESFQNRKTKWNQLDSTFQQKVLDIVSPMQAKIDKHFPVE